MIYLLGGYMWLFIHRPFEVWPWLGKLHIERVYMLATILYWAIAGDKQWISNRLNAAFAEFGVKVQTRQYEEFYRELCPKNRGSVRSMRDATTALT
jgi:hypothetical protein